MKKNLLFMALMGIGELCTAQNTAWSLTDAIGIGTTSPAAMLDIRTSSSQSVGLSISPVGSNHSYLMLDRKTAYDGGIIFRRDGVNSWHQINGDNDELLWYSYGKTGGGQHVVTITKEGNMGIGAHAAAPQSKLQINGDMRFGNSGTNYAVSGVDWVGAYTEVYGATADVNQIRIQSSTRGGLANYNGMLVGETAVNSSGGIQFYTGGFNNNRMVITSIGRVGIGTATPAEMLSVNGKVRAQEVKVEATNWPDYVFEKGYELAGLDHVKQFITEHKHLPGIPSAAEVKSTGIQLGEMDAKLLKKIEELTLYLLAQQKTIEEQNKRIKGLEARIK